MMNGDAMNCATAEVLLADWLEGETGEEIAKLERHLAGCASCRSLAKDLRRIVVAAASLPMEAPERDLWPEVELRLTPRSLDYAASLQDRELSLERPAARTPARTHWRAPLAAAAAVLVFASGAWLMLQDNSAASDNAAASSATASGVAEAPLAAGTAPATAPNGTTLASLPSVNSAQLLEQSYGAEIDALTTILQNENGVLDTATVTVLRRNLDIIDAAIRESREALEQDPASILLTEQLNAAFEMKLDMLRRTVLLSSGA